MNKPSVLFLCTGNSCRSLMGEALLRQKAGERFEVYSAGTRPKCVNPLTRHVLEEVGIDTSDLASKNVAQFLGKMPVKHVIVVCHEAQDDCPRIFPGMGEKLFWPFDDPPAFNGTDIDKLNEFRRVRDEIAAKLDEWLQPKE